MTIVIVGILLLLVIFFTYRYIKAVERKEGELEDMDNFSTKVSLLDRGLTLLDRKEIIERKINDIKERNKNYDK